MKRKVFCKVCALAAAGCLAVSMSACGKEEAETVVDTLAGDGTEPAEAETASGQAAEASAAAVNMVNAEEMFTDRDLSGEYDEGDCSKINLGSGTVTISEEGTYILTGSLEDGMVIVDADESAKIQLVLDGVAIANREGAAIYVRQADKVFITLTDGSVNTLANGGSYTSIDDNNMDGVIFSKCDLTINGKGSLNIDAQAGHGIVSKDDLKITGGTVTVTAERHGISGKDSVRVAAGTLNITSGKDGIHSENADKEDKGYVYLADGSLTVESQGDCISAGAWLQIDGGVYNLTAGEGSSNGTVSTDETGEAVSTKGVKAGERLVVNAGSFNIDSQDDALHSDGSLTVNGGEFQISTGDDGLHSDETTTVAGGNIDIGICYEGIEGEKVVISGGNIRLYATDDGVNAAGGNDGSGFGGRFGGDFRGFGRGASDGDANSSILISGGQLYINADGDGIDSNGTLTVTGGEVYVSGPESGADGALDYESEGRITGGTVVAAGSAQMAMNFGGTSTQGSILTNNVNGEAGTEIVLKDSEGETLVSYTAEKSFQSVVISCPGLVQGGSYTLAAGGSETEITLDSLVYGSGFGMGGFGGQDGRRQGGENPEPPAEGDMQDRPEFPAEGGMQDRPEFPADSDMQDRPEFPADSDMQDRPEPPAEGDMQDRPEPPAEGDMPRQQNGDVSEMQR